MRALERGDQQRDLWCVRIGSGGEQPCRGGNGLLCSAATGMPRGPLAPGLSLQFQLLQGQASKQALAAGIKLPQVPCTSRWLAVCLDRPDTSLLGLSGSCGSCPSFPGNSAGCGKAMGQERTCSREALRTRPRPFLSGNSCPLPMRTTWPSLSASEAKHLASPTGHLRGSPYAQA